MPLELYLKLKKTIYYETSKDMNDIKLFLDQLPVKLKSETSLYVYENMYKKIKYFKDKNFSFIIWMCALLKPLFFEENIYFY